MPRLAFIRNDIVKNGNRCRISKVFVNKLSRKVNPSRFALIFFLFFFLWLYLQSARLVHQDRIHRLQDKSMIEKARGFFRLRKLRLFLEIQLQNFLPFSNEFNLTNGLRDPYIIIETKQFLLLVLGSFLFSTIFLVTSHSFPGTS